MNMKPMEDYFASKIHKPFYMVVGDKEYREAIDSFKAGQSVYCISMSAVKILTNSLT